MKSSLVLSDTDTHLNEFAQYNTTDHENIDDEDLEHSHKHKHRKNGREHDHDHNHTKITQSEVKVLSTSYKLATLVVEIKSGDIFSQKILISTPHPFGIFRPPIS